MKKRSVLVCINMGPDRWWISLQFYDENSKLNRLVIEDATTAMCDACALIARHYGGENYSRFNHL